MVLITIITPTYNREEYLKRCFESLNNQTCYDFEWLVIDDGSTDATQKVINQCRIQNHNRFPINYIKKKNGGKHTALNTSHEYINGRYCFVLDSDDILVPTAVKDILDEWKQWGKQDGVGRIIFLKAGLQNPQKAICYVKNYNVPVNTLKEKRIGLTGRDCCDTFLSELFIKYKFPVFPGEKFIGEGAGWLPIELETLAVYINKVVYLCEYLEDGLTESGRKMRLLNPLGGMYNSKIYMCREMPLKTRVKKAILYVCYGHFANKKYPEFFYNNNHRLLTVICWIPGYFLYLYWRKKYF